MKKILILVLLLCSYIANAQVEPQDTDGDGYRNVSTLDHLRWISENKSGWTLNYKLENDINAADTKNWNEGKGWSPIGCATKPYSGFFNGQGFKIDSLFIDRPLQDTIGLFGYANESSIIYNLKVTNCDITGMTWIGGLVGRNYGNITECSTTGLVIGMAKGVGGLMGFNGSMSPSCNYSTADVTGVNSTGGLIGYNGGRISDSYAIGNIKGSGYSTGGFIGSNSDIGYVTNCYSCGKVSGKENVGGFIGYSFGYSISYCFWDKETSGLDTSAKGIGKTTQEMKTKSTFINAGWHFLSIWKMDSSINDGYPYIEIRKIGKQPKDTDSDGSLNIGCYLHLLWISENSISWSSKFELDHDISADSSKFSGTLLEFTPIGTSSIPFKGIFDGNGYCIDSLIISLPRQGNIGLFGVIDTGAEIRHLSITNFNIKGLSSTGALAGHNKGKLINCNSDGSIVSGDNTGGLVGYNNYGEISHCSSVGTVSGRNYTGGLVGMTETGKLVYSYSKCAVSGANSTGGLIGLNVASVSNCYSLGNVAGSDDNTGGLVGLNAYDGRMSDCYSRGLVKSSGNNTGGLIGLAEYAPVSNCYSTGRVTSTGTSAGGLVGSTREADIKNSFFDTEISGMSISNGGNGKSTATMKTKKTFTDAGWDFDNIWDINPQVNDGYPFIIGKATDVIENRQDLSHIFISPNPSTDFITINFNSSEGSAIQIFNTLGELVMSAEARHAVPLRINISNLPKGMYFVRIGDETAKFVKM
ncbi:MAG: T9SS type A sorting domain-containing protein [bacterium]